MIHAPVRDVGGGRRVGSVTARAVAAAAREWQGPPVPFLQRHAHLC